MTRPRVLKPLIRAFFAVLLLGVLCAGVLAWRLSRAPIPLDYLAPRIEAALAELAPHATAKVGRVELAWVRRRPAIRVYDLRLLDTDGSSLASLPELAVRPSLRAALKRRAAVAWIGLTGARLSLARTPEGRIIIDTAEENVPAKGGGTAKLLSQLIANRSRGGAAAYLSGIDVEDAQVDLDDRGADVGWQAANAKIALRFYPQRLWLRLDGDVAGHSSTNVFVRDVGLALAAVADAAVDADGNITELRFDVHGEHGHFASYADPNALVPMGFIDLRGDYSRQAKAVRIARLRAGSAAARLEATVRIPLEPDEPVQAEGVLHSVAATDLPSLWPPTFETTTRHWIEQNVREGTIPTCRFVLRMPRHHEGPLPAEALNITFDVEGLTVGFLEHFEPLHALRGSATLTGARFTADIESAASAGLNLHEGHIDIDLHVHPAQGVITAQINGATPDMLAVIDQPPLEIPKKLEFSPGAAAGKGEVHLELHLPFMHGTTSKDVHVLASADLRKTSHSDLRYGIGIDNASLHLDIDDGRVAVQGDADLVNAPVAVGRVHMDFVVSRPTPARSVKGSVTADGFVGEGTLNFEGGGLRTVTLSTLRYGRTDISADLARDASGRTHISLSGDVFDLKPLLERSDDKGQGEPSKVPWPTWDAEFVLKRVLTDHDLQIVNAEGRARGEAKELRELHAEGGLAGGGALRAEYTTDDGSRPRYEFSTDDGGRVLKEMGIDLHLQGGTLSVAGVIDERASSHIVQGEIQMDDFKVVQAPLLAQLLSLGSLEGIANTLRREGIAFTRARVPFAWSQNEFEFRDARAVGAIGLTGEGVLDRASGDLDISGQIIPAYTLNSALGRIPLIGSLLVGGEGQGVFGINYRVAGTRDKPEISVNPLSALAPGILRQMFIDPFTHKPANSERERAAAPQD